ncbi:MAG: hypothetical protein ACOCR6_01890 [archaeon]
MSSPAEKLRDAARMVREAGEEAPEMDLEDPPAELKGVEIPTVFEVSEEIAKVLTELALIVEVNQDDE